MIETTNLKLEKYELTDAANLADGYNNSMEKIDAYAGSVNDRFPITSADIEDGGINTVDIANGAITENKLAADAVTSDKLASNSVGTEHVQDEAITTPKIADGAVTTAKLAEGAITTDVLPSSLVTDVANNKTLVEEHVNYFTDLGVTDEQSANDLHTQIDNTYQAAMSNTQAITDLQNATVGTSKLEDGAVTRPKIATSAFDAAPTEDSDNLISSGAVYNAIQGFEPGKNRKIVWIGDSYSAISTDAPFDWVSQVGENLGAEIHSYAFNGGGFKTGSSGTFATQIQSAIDDTSFTNDSITDIVIYGGTNDLSFFNAGTLNFSSAFNLIKNNFEKAVVWIAVCNHAITITNREQLNSFVMPYIQSCIDAAQTAQLNFSIIPDVYLWQPTWGIAGYVSSTDLHPNVAMRKELAKVFTSALNGGEYKLRHELTFTPINGITTIAPNGGSKIYIENGVINPRNIVITVGNSNIGSGTYLASGDVLQLPFENTEVGTMSGAPKAVLQVGGTVSGNTLRMYGTLNAKDILQVNLPQRIL